LIGPAMGCQMRVLTLIDMNFQKFSGKIILVVSAVQLFSFEEKLPIYILLPCFILLQVAAKQLTLKNVTDYIVDIICKRSDLGYNYGVILVPEGLIDFIPEVGYFFCNFSGTAPMLFFFILM
jgi:hypothetical protein